MSQALDRAFAALADPVRRRAVEALRERPHSAGELAARLGISTPKMSKHLKALHVGGLVEDAHPAFDARVRIYRLRREPIAALRHWIEAAEVLWVEELAAFRAHLEKRGDA
jgi:DNA-binding transcriptional ArsR family regulator